MSNATASAASPSGRFGVVGAGAWGTALAQLLASDGSPVTLWAHEAEVVADIAEHRENKTFLPGLPLAPSLHATQALADLMHVDGAQPDALLVVVPVQHMRRVLADLAAQAPGLVHVPLVLCSKGMEAGTQALPCDIVADVLPDAPIAVLSGPTFAHEVAAGKPTAITLAAQPLALAEQLAARIARPHFRPYASGDVIGAEIGGAVKNVLAIACGVVEGAGLGLNARAALISRGFAEMTRFGVALGADPATLAGLAGLGDLVLTCTSTNSRNFSLGKGIGEGQRVADLMADRRTVAEGSASAPVVLTAAQARGIDMPIVAAVNALLAGDQPVRHVIAALLNRPLRSEGA